MQNLTNKIVLSLLKKLGLTNVKAALTAPFGTGMAIALSLRGLYNFHGINSREKYKVIYCRADHKSPLKGIRFVGLEPIIVEGHFGANAFAPEGVFIDPNDVKNEYEKDPERIGAIVSTTSFFAPRVPDDVKNLAKFAKEHNLIHVINNAYGVQVPEFLELIRSAIDAGRVDAIVQSTDKNFLTPVGGAVIVSPRREAITTISETYAGRASAAPVTQLLVSLLSMGSFGFSRLIEEQKANRKLLEKLMHQLANDVGEHIIQCNNPVSCVMTLKSMDPRHVDQLGGYLYNLRVTGPRVVRPDGERNFGMCTKEISWPYLVVNSAIGVKREHIVESVNRIRKAFAQMK